MRGDADPLRIRRWPIFAAGGRTCGASAEPPADAEIRARSDDAALAATAAEADSCASTLDAQERTIRFASYEHALDSLLTPAARSRGWSLPIRPFANSATALQAPQADSRVSLDASGLAAQYVVGFIDVDFARQTVTFTEANLRDGYDERVDTVSPPAAWWTAAREVAWPLLDSGLRS